MGPEKGPRTDAHAADEPDTLQGGRTKTLDGSKNIEQLQKSERHTTPTRQLSGVADEESVDEEDAEGTPSILDRVVSSVASRSSFDPGPPPDGGWLAWSQCECCLFTSCFSRRIQLQC